VIVFPPSLSLKWQDEMRDKFGLQFTIVNSELMAQVRRTHGLHANPFLMFPRVIVSMAWLPQVRAQRLLRDVYAQAANPATGKRFAFDILIVDEAHHVAPASPPAIAGGRGYAVDTQRTIAVRQLAEVCEHRLFLSATPHNGHPESFTALLEMIDPRRFSRGALLDSAALADITVRRLKRDLPEKGFRRRVVQALPFTPRDDEQEMFALLDQILTRSAELNDKKAGGDIVTMLLKKRFLSSPFAFGQTLVRYLAAWPGRGLRGDDYDDILGEGQSDEEEGLWEQDEAARLRESKSSDPLAASAPGQLETLAEWGLSYESRANSKLDELLMFLDAVCRPDGARWTNERVVVFTEYAHTVDWLARVLTQRGYADRLAVIQGATSSEERELTRLRFTAEPAAEPVRVLLATDAAGEGIDLQDHCCRLVNFDIPFNPSRLEQRIGRIDRYGQKREPQVFHFAPVTSSSVYAADASFMARIARRVANIEEDLGSVNQVIGTDIQRHFTGRAPARTKARTVSPDEVINTALAGGLELNARLTQLEQGYDESRAQLHLDPANLRRVVDTALRMNHQPPLIHNHDLAQDTDAEVFTLPPLSAGWTAALTGLATRLRPEVQRPITFDPAARESDALVYVHLGHPIVQKAQRLLRRSLWSADSPLSRVTAVVVDDLAESFVAAVTRMVLVGRGGVRLHEEVFLAGVRLRGRRAMAEEKAEAALDHALDGERLALADIAVRDQLCDLWNAPEAPVRVRLEESMRARAARRHDLVVGQLARREAADTERAREIFAAFRRNLDDSLVLLRQAEEEAAAMLFPDDQQRQRRRDIDAMQRRRDELGDEETREVAAIADRYAEVKPHVTAAAVVFALTRADAEGWVS
jgi:superfamily II DNA or RNA helicase